MSPFRQPRLWFRVRRQRRKLGQATARSSDPGFDGKAADLDAQTDVIVREMAAVLEQRARLRERESKLTDNDHQEPQRYHGRRRNGGTAPSAGA